MSERDYSENDIAIVGMAAHLPSAPSVDAYWQNLVEGKECIRRLDDEALAAAGVPRETLRHPHYVKAAAILDGLEQFDADFFGFSPKEAAIMDPQHRQFLECSWEALESAGHVPSTFDGAIGVFAGSGMPGYFIFNVLTNADLIKNVGLFLLRHTGNDKDFLSTRVSYCFDLKGPSVNVQTACSTSLVATHYAVQALLSGECDLALAGGVTIELPHGRGYMYEEGEILSPDGHCRAFDHRSQGTVFGSGAGVVALRRLDDALEDGDHVYAIIKGTAINNDGGGKVGYLAPSVDGQAAAVAEAIAVAGVDPESVTYIECHGTGTPVGDPIEVAALTQAYRSAGAEDNGFCGIGSVKTNIGHLDTAAGVASLIKAAKACETGKLPPSLNWEAPNPEIDFASSPFYVNHQLSDWKPKGGHPRRAGINSLGVGGTNAHAIIEEPPPARPDKASPRSHQPLVLAARSRRALDDAQKNLAAWLNDHKEANLADVAHTLLEGRQGFDERRVLAARNVKDAIELLTDNDKQRVFTHTVTQGTPSLVFLFPGGGAQYLNMGRGLLATEPVFKKRIDQGLKILKERHNVDLEPLLYGDGDEQARAAKLEEPGVQLPAIFLVEMALADLWRSWGFEPAALLGHSMGENTAACVAGVLSFEDALGLVRLRGQLMDEVPAGGMLSVPLPPDEIEPLLKSGVGASGEKLDELDLGVINAPDLCVVSGPAEPLEQLRQKLADDGIEARRIRIHIAAHSRMLDGILERFMKYLEGVKLSAPEIPIVSNRTGDFLTDEQATSPDYWVDHLRHTVRFADCVGTLAQDESRVYLEVGPGKTLSSLTRMHPRVKPTQTVISSLRHQDEDTDDNAFFTTVLGRLWGGGLALDRDKLWPEGGRKRLPLPTYPFQRSPYFIEPGQVLATDEKRAGDELMKLASDDDWYWRPVWRRRDAEGPDLHELPPQTWLFFCDEFGVGDALAARLRGLGHDVVTVKDGDAYARLDEHTYRLSAEHGRDGYDALVRDLVADAKMPDRVAHLWLLAQEETFRPGSSFFHRNQERGFYSLFFLAQALGPELGHRDLHIEVATCGMQRVDDEHVPYPEQATVLGPLGVIPREMPQIRCSVVDVELPRPGAASYAAKGLQGLKEMARRRGASADRLFAELAEVTGVGPSFDDVVSSIAEELCAAEGGSIIARRGLERWVREDRKVIPQPTAAPPLREGATVLITGGLGGIGLQMARHLASSRKAKLVLTSRSGLPPTDAWDDLVRQHSPDHPVRRRIDAVRELEQLGATVMTPAADVSDVVAMKAAVAAADKELGRVVAVIHAAGTLADDLIAMKSQSSCEVVFTPKVYGTMVLDEIFADRQLDAFVVFASTSTRIRAAGQVDYVAANAFLNAFAQSRRGRHKRVVAINWGVWNEVGMAADAAQRMLRGDEAPAAEAPAVHPARHPLYKGRVERDGHTVLLAELSPAEHWILDEHRTRDGQALIPGTGYLELARAAVAELEGDQPIEIRDLFFFRPLAIEDDEVREVEVRLTRDDQGYGFEIFSRRTLADGRRGWERHAQARVLLLPLEVPPSLDVEATFQRCDKEHVGPTPRGITTPQEQHLLFGPRWRVLREAAYGETEAIGRLSLADDYAGEADAYKLHPALLDLTTGWAMKLIPGYDASGLWVPVSYPSFQLLRPMPARVISHVSKCDLEEGFARFDILITDEAGEPVANIRRFTIRQLPEDQATFGKVAPPVAADLEDVESGRHELSPAELAFQHNLTQGILPDEGARAFDRATFGTDASEVVVSSLSLEALVRQADEAAIPENNGEPGARFQRPELGSDYVGPRDDIERALVEFWEELLGVDQIGVQDSFFDLGGHSLIAVRLFAKIKKAFHVDFPISVLFEAPTIEACAELIKEARGGEGDDETTVEDTHKTRYTHLVSMHPGEGGPKRPFFLVAGMFGNVLNLRHLAHLIGTDRRFYGLQARGLYGDHEPHETFEEMAADYLKELRSVQPRGPYMIGGFSGGGITAWEMARQLRADGEEVALLVFLDTPLPVSELMTRKEKVQMHLQNLQKKGRGYLFEWARNRVEWELGKVERALKGEDDQPADNLSFNNDVIEAAFYRALERYDLQKQPVDLHLYRPPLQPTHEFGAGRAINADRRFIYEDNGWSDWVSKAVVHEVPGDHDSMVLEPNVRVLAGLLAEAIAEADAKYPLTTDEPASDAA